MDELKKRYIPPPPINIRFHFLIIVIIGMVTATILPKFAIKIGGYNPKKRAQSDIITITKILESYNQQNGVYPTIDQELNALLKKPITNPIPKNWDGPYLKKIPQDPWGHDYKYKCPGAHNLKNFDLWSVGKDGIDRTDDDITNWGPRISP